MKFIKCLITICVSASLFGFSSDMGNENECTKAYTCARDNVNELVDKQQELNSEYISEIKKVSFK